MDQNDRSGVVINDLLYNLTGINGCCIQCAGEKCSEGNKMVLAV